MKKTMLMTSSIFVLFIIWILIYEMINHPLLLPSPIDVFKALFEIMSQKTYLIDIVYTIARLALAILSSAILGIVLGIISGFRKHFASFLKPYITILRTIPVISIVVILLILFGYTYTPYIITFLMVFPIIYQGVLEGIHQLDQELIDVYHLEEHDTFLGLKFVYFPLIKNYILLAFLQSFGLGIKVLVMAEYLSQSKNSMGNAIYLAKINLEYAFVFAWTILLILISFSIEYLIHHYQKRQES